MEGTQVKDEVSTSLNLRQPGCRPWRAGSLSQIGGSVCWVRPLPPWRQACLLGRGCGQLIYQFLVYPGSKPQRGQ